MKPITVKDVVRQSANGLFTDKLSEEKLDVITHKLIQGENLGRFIREMEEMILAERKAKWKKK